MDNSYILIAGAIVLVVAILLFVLVRSRKQHVDFSAPAPMPKAARPSPPPAPAAQPVAVPDPVPLADAPAPGVEPGLTRLKGLGPKAAARLAELGVSRIEQIAAWSDDDIARIDPQMGAFKGRIARDRWVHQARMLTDGDTTAYEAEFGKLGS